MTISLYIYHQGTNRDHLLKPEHSPAIPRELAQYVAKSDLIFCPCHSNMLSRLDFTLDWNILVSITQNITTCNKTHFALN